MVSPEKINEKVSPYSLMLVVDGKTVFVPDVMGDEFYGKVKERIAIDLGVELKDVTDEAIFQDDLNADSLDLVEMLMALEEMFKDHLGLKEDVTIPEEDSEIITRVKHARDYFNVWQSGDQKLLGVWRSVRNDEIKAYLKEKAKPTA